MVPALRDIFNQNSKSAITIPTATSVHMGLEPCSTIKYCKKFITGFEKSL
jgi:hypothetical protein